MIEDKIDKIRKLLALAGNNPSRAEAEAAWAKALVMIAQLKGKPLSDTDLRHWYLDSAAPCPWVIVVSTNISGNEYVSVKAADMIDKQKNDQTLPTWRLIEVPLAFRSKSESEIFQACRDERIVWRSKAPTGPGFKYRSAICTPKTSSPKS